ncbi:hypothetical protein [Winogradskyella wichelsiae]|uniref:hypothetical protein n=1 Tax=Winogradskyella wichelsiae TaxID=2697007 RepID=UPI0015CE1FFE|nr:hypothetical protein [Winogradskyella wichelsiae]
MKVTKTHVKTKIDYNVQLELIILGVILLIIGLSIEFFKTESVGFWWCFLGVIVVLFGLWNIRTYEIEDNCFKIHRFLGLITKERKLSTLVSFKIKPVDFSISNKAFFVLAIYAKRSNYLRFRKVKLKFLDGSTMRINENFIKGNTLNELLHHIKKHQKKNEY